MAPKLITSAVVFVAVIFASNQHIFGINGKPILCVPGSDMDPLLRSYADESTHLQPGSGHTPGFSFLFHAQTVRSVIPGYIIIPGLKGHPYANALSGTIGFLGQQDRARLGPAMRARDTEDEWYARGQCPEPTVRSLPDTTFYEIRCRANADYASIWDRAPAPRVTMSRPNDFVLATCDYENIPAGPYKGRSLRNCARVVIIDGFLVDYRFQEENVRFIPQIDSMIRDKLKQWKKTVLFRYSGLSSGASCLTLASTKAASDSSGLSRLIVLVSRVYRG